MKFPGVLLDGSREKEVVPELDAACLDGGQLRVMPAAFYARYRRNDLAVWCLRRGFYCLPTHELAEWLSETIGADSAIEIGAGHGALHLAGVPATDSYQQEDLLMRELYAGLGQATVPYGKHVEKLTALQAVDKYQPTVVLGCWVTHRYTKEAGGNAWGIDEGKLLRKPSVRRYIFVGHERVHEHKPILRIPHSTHRMAFLYSRATDARDVVWIWEHPEG